MWRNREPVTSTSDTGGALRSAAAHGKKLVSVSLLSVTLAACGSTSSISSPTSAAAAGSPFATVAASTSMPDPCVLLTQADFEKVLGGTISTGVADTIDGEARCTFTLPMVASEAVAAEYDDLIDASTLAQYQSVKKIEMGHPGSVAVAGVGDDAYYETYDDTLTYFKDQSEGSVQAVGNTGSLGANETQIKTELIALAKIAAARS